MAPPIQPILENENVRIEPLVEDDFAFLFDVAADPKVWEQHPNKDRYKKDVFEAFFRSAIESGGAFKIYDKQTGEVAGSTRFYDFDIQANTICIGYTFYGRRFWGTGLNSQVKQLMLDHIFGYVDKVYLHVGITNFRSQIAVSRLGAAKVGEQEGSYIYEINRPQRD